jgi:hypothetical protein
MVKFLGASIFGGFGTPRCIGGRLVNKNQAAREL